MILKSEAFGFQQFKSLSVNSPCMSSLLFYVAPVATEAGQATDFLKSHGLDCKNGGSWKEVELELKNN